MNTFVVNLRYGNWENQICFTPLTDITAEEDIVKTEKTELLRAAILNSPKGGAKEIFCGLVPKIDVIAKECGNRCGGNMLNELDFLSEVTAMFKENGFVRIQR